MNNIKTGIQSFGRKFELTKEADDAINVSLAGLKGKNRAQVLDSYDNLISSIINSDYDVFVSKTLDGKLVANVTPSGKMNVISSEKTEKPIFKKVSNPIEFIEKAFNLVIKRKWKSLQT